MFVCAVCLSGSATRRRRRAHRRRTTAIAASLGTSYFFYTFVLNIKFFPFMNVLVAVIALGKMADTIKQLPAQPVFSNN